MIAAQYGDLEMIRLSAGIQGRHGRCEQQPTILPWPMPFRPERQVRCKILVDSGANVNHLIRKKPEPL